MECGPVPSSQRHTHMANEREKIIEVLLSQERVLTLLYDKTFPPRSQSVGFTGQLGNHYTSAAQSMAAAFRAAYSWAEGNTDMGQCRFP